jgi:hypothetical protein
VSRARRSSSRLSELRRMEMKYAQRKVLRRGLASQVRSNDYKRSTKAEQDLIRFSIVYFVFVYHSVFVQLKAVAIEIVSTMSVLLKRKQ